MPDAECTHAHEAERVDWFRAASEQCKGLGPRHTSDNCFMLAEVKDVLCIAVNVAACSAKCKRKPVHGRRNAQVRRKTELLTSSSAMCDLSSAITSSLCTAFARSSTSSLSAPLPSCKTVGLFDIEASVMKLRTLNSFQKLWPIQCHS
jgi:hypothetical protein